MPCTVRACATNASLEEPRSGHDRFVWKRPESRSRATPILDRASRGVNEQYQDTGHRTCLSLLCDDHMLKSPQDEEYREREEAILTSNAEKIVDLLAMYLQAQGE